MKICLLACGLWLTATASLVAQSRVSVAPVYWYNYGQYKYQVHSTYDGSDTQLSGHANSSSIGLISRYHFTPKWDISVGALLNRNSSRLTNINSPQTDIGIIRTYIQVPVLANYRLTDRRLSPYFSVGALLGKGQTSAPVKMNGVIGIGVDYRFNSSLSLLLQPTATYLFDKPASNILVQISGYSSYNLGVQTQLIWHFK